MITKLYVHHLTESDPTSITEKRLTVDHTVNKFKADVQKTKEILLCGKHQNPTVICQKAIRNVEAKVSMIPLVARFGQDVQKFKLPFKVVDEAQDTDFEFIFIKSIKPADISEESLEHKQFAVFECMTFFCLPAVLKVGSENPATLTVQLNLNNEKLARLPRHLLSMQLTKLLVARVKGTNLIQSFYVTINLVDIPAWIGNNTELAYEQ